MHSPLTRERSACWTWLCFCSTRDGRFPWPSCASSLANIAPPSRKPEPAPFERDKATLLEMGVPLRFVTQEEDSETPAEGGYLIDRQRYRLPEINLTADEVAVLVTTAAAARSQNEFPYRHAAEMAMRKDVRPVGHVGKPRRRPAQGQLCPRPDGKRGRAAPANGVPAPARSASTWSRFRKRCICASA